MAIIKCKMCGGDLVLVPDSTVVECEYCGTQQTVPSADNERKMTLFNRANRLRFACEFDKASGIYEAIVADFPEEAEAYWGLVLCKYGIEYVDDPATAKKIPTCHRSSFDSVMDDENFEQALENADAVARKVYRSETKQIEEIRKGILEVSSKEDPYDIFICYKETDENGNRTLDSVLAQDIYDALTEKGYRTFFARITLEDKLGQEYEPYIFAALNSAKVMLAVGTDYEYYNAVWVKNEWSRFLHLIASGQKKSLIPCYKNIDAYDMPKEFAKLQAQDLGKVGAMQDLLRGIEKILPKRISEANTFSATSVAYSSDINSGSTVVMGFMDYELGKTDSAAGVFRQALMNNSECPEAYLGLLLVTKGSEWNAIREKFLQYAPQKMSDLEKKVFTPKMQNTLLYLYCQLGDPVRFSEALDCCAESISLDVFAKILLAAPTSEMIKALVAHGCDPNGIIHVTENYGNAEYTLLNYLMLKGASCEILDTLLNCGADPNGNRVWYIKNGWVNRYSALWDSFCKYKNIEYSKTLVRHGADIHFVAKITNQNGEYSEKSLLHEVVLEGNEEMVKLLLENGADPNVNCLLRKQHGNCVYSPLYDAIGKRQNTALVNSLLDCGADPSFRANTYYNDGSYEVTSCVSKAVLNNSIAITQRLLEHKADPNATRLFRNKMGTNVFSPLYDSIQNCRDTAMVELLLKHGADPSFQADIYHTDGSYEKASCISQAVINKQNSIVRMLLEQAADPNSNRMFSDRYGRSIYSPLYDAATMHTDSELITLLLEYEADHSFRATLYKKDGVCESVPILSGAVLKNNLIGAEALLKNGADPNCIRKREHAGKTTFHNALSDSLLIKNDKRMSELLIRNNADLNCTNMLEAEDGYLKHTLLNQAVATQDSEKLVMLLQLGADPNSLRIVKNGDGESFYTALNDSICRYKNLEIAKILLAYGADVSLKSRVHHNGTYEERTPLSYAISQNDLVFIKLLLQHGADPNVLRFEQNDTGVSNYFSPLGDCITQNMDSSVVALLLEHGADAARSEPYVYFKADGRVYQTSRVAIVPMLFLTAATTNHIHGSDFRASEIIRLLVDYGASLNAVVDFRGVKCPIRKFPFTGIGVKGDTLMALQQVGWKGPGLFDRFTLSV